MRLNKKILSLTLAAILSLSLLTVSAAGTVEISVDYMNSISVSGVIDAEGMRPADIMVRLTSSSGELVYVDASKTIADDEGNLSYSFDTGLLSLSLPSDTYKISISGRNLKTPLTDTIDIHGADRKLEVIKAISDASAASAVKNAITGTTDGKDNYDILKFDIGLYNDLETDDGNFVDTYLAPKTYDVSVDTADGLSDEEIVKIHSAIEVFHKDYTDAVASSLFAMIGSENDFNSWYDTYYKHYEFDKNDKVTAIVKEVMTESDFIRRMTEQSEVMSIDEIREFIYESALCTYVYSRTDAEVQELISDFPEYFTVSTDSYGALKDYELPTVIDKVAGNIYDNCKAASEALDESAKEVISARDSNEDDDDDDYRGGISVGTGGGGYKPPKEDKPKEEIKPAEPVIFSDLDSAAWAKDAIIALYDKGIINGMPDGRFMPNANITRAEFIKIAVEALVLEESADNVFADVPEGSWYAPYVSKAYAAGLVKGDDSNNFNPNADITRQDMTTILYRALDIQDDNIAETTFTDKEAIAEYAYPAVRYFSSKGIVNGIGDGSFAPKRNATRAEAAAIFYRLLNSLL